MMVDLLFSMIGVDLAVLRVILKKKPDAKDKKIK